MNGISILDAFANSCEKGLLATWEKSFYTGRIFMEFYIGEYFLFC